MFCRIGEGEAGSVSGFTQSLTKQEQQELRDYLRTWGDPEALALAMRFPLDQTGLERAAGTFSARKRQMPISPVVSQNQAVLKLLFGGSTDLIFRESEVGLDRRPALLVHLDALVNQDYIMSVLDNLMVRLRHEPLPADPGELERQLVRRSITASDVTRAQNMDDISVGVLTGDCVLLVDGLAAGVKFAAQGWERRAPEEPISEPVVRGPKVGFTESVAVNLGLLRRFIQDERLRVEHIVVGERSRTSVFLVYINDVAAKGLVEEARQRLDRIQIDGILESGYIHELIEDTPLTPFPLLQATERPDVVAGGLLEGKIALLVDNTPHALILPGTFPAMLQAAEDYYVHWTWGSFTRLLRYLYLLMALLGPAIYIAIVTYHHEMLPTDLLLSIMAAREAVPFPALVEALLMELTFEALREAGIRLPKPVGQAVSIVGGLVIGQSAVQAGIVSPAMIIVVAVTGIASFIIPNFSMAIAVRMLRFPMMILAATFGFLGIAFGLIAISIHLASLRSFGVPYLSPVIPDSLEEFKDIGIRAPWWAMKKRPAALYLRNRKREASNLKPGPHQ